MHFSIRVFGTSEAHDMSTVSIPISTQTSFVRQSSFAQDIWRRFRRNRLAVVGLGIVIILCVVAALADYVAPYNPIEVNLDIQFEPPSMQHLFGTDLYGRDLLSRVIYGARISLLIGFIPSAISMIIGAVLGVLSAFYGGWVDTLIMRIADVVLAFPSIILAMVVTYTLGASLFTLFIALSVVGWAGAARVVRAQALAIKETDFVTASKSIGASNRRIMFNHIIPNCIAPILVLFTLNIPDAIMAEAGLSFLGVGAQPPTPSWGLMTNEAQQYVFNAPWASIMPGLAILLTTLGFNFVGDGLRDAIDPYLKSKI